MGSRNRNRANDRIFAPTSGIGLCDSFFMEGFLRLQELRVFCHRADYSEYCLAYLLTSRDFGGTLGSFEAVRSRSSKFVLLSPDRGFFSSFSQEWPSRRACARTLAG